MGRSWLAICAALLCSSVAFAGYSTNKKDLESAAELAVERAAEKAAERAVEKALNSGNSSTITVTVKEAYENTKKIAEEAAAPGSESTRPHDSTMHDRQYAHQPPVDGEYSVVESAGVEELGVSKESLNSSAEDLGSAEVTEESDKREADGNSDVDLSLDLTSFDDSLEKTTESSVKDFDISLGIGFGVDFDSLNMSGDFRSKSSTSKGTETFTSSYSPPPLKKESEDSVDVDDEEDAKVFGKYASDFNRSGWSSSKQKGWVRYRPLWDDSKSLVNRGSVWDELIRSAKSDGEKNRTKKSIDKPRLFKRNVGDQEVTESTNQIAVPLVSLPLDPKAPALLYQLPQKELKYSTSNYSIKTPIRSVPHHLFVSVPYLRANNHQNDKEVTLITSRSYEPAVAPRQINDEIDDQGSAETKKPAKRSNDFNFGLRTFLSVANRNNDFQNNHQTQRGRRHHHSLVKVTKHQLDFKSSTIKPILKTARTKAKA